MDSDTHAEKVKRSSSSSNHPNGQHSEKELQQQVRFLPASFSNNSQFNRDEGAHMQSELLDAIVELDYEVRNVVNEFGTGSPNIQRLVKIRDDLIRIRNEMMEASR